MQLIRRIVRSESIRAALCWLGSWYIRFVYYSSRWETLNGDVPAEFWQSGRPFILAMWHGRFLMFPYAWARNKRIYMLISKHRDGQIISRTVGHLGLFTIAGSSSRGGTQALREMLNALKAGSCIGITPDGPRGPRMHASDGIVGVARLSGVPVIPIALNTSRRSVLSSWDRFLVALPFSRGVVAWGNPIEIDRDADQQTQEAARLEIEGSLNDLCQQVDRFFDHEIITPDKVEATP